MSSMQNVILNMPNSEKSWNFHRIDRKHVAAHLTQLNHRRNIGRLRFDLNSLTSLLYSMCRTTLHWKHGCKVQSKWTSVTENFREIIKRRIFNRRRGPRSYTTKCSPTSHHRSSNSRKAKSTDKRLRRESELDLLRTLAVHTSQHYGHRLQDRIYSSVLLVNRFLFNCLFIMAWLRSRTGAKFANKSLVWFVSKLNHNWNILRRQSVWTVAW